MASAVTRSLLLALTLVASLNSCHYGEAVLVPGVFSDVRLNLALGLQRYQGELTCAQLERAGELVSREDFGAVEIHQLAAFDALSLDPDAPPGTGSYGAALLSADGVLSESLVTWCVPPEAHRVVSSAYSPPREAFIVEALGDRVELLGRDAMIVHGSL